MSVIILRGDARSLPLPDGSVDLIVTSPPYFGQRDYRDGDASLAGQIGSEATPQEYIAALLECTREWVRVLKPGGSLFVNLGDKYSGFTGPNWGNGRNPGGGERRPASVPAGGIVSAPAAYGIPNKSLMGLPWRYAIGCVDQLGLILRAEVIWAKPNGLPESVTDRVRRSHEQLFHFTRQPRYFSAVDEIREAHTMRPQRRPGGHKQRQQLGVLPAQTHSTSQRDEPGVDGHPLGKLPGSVWDIALQPLSVPSHLDTEHYAAYPMDIPRRVILGWSPSGICTGCGEGRRPVATAAGLDMGRPQARRAHQLAERGGLTEDHLAALLSVGISDTGRGAATQDGTGRNTPEVYALAARARAVLGGYAREYLLRRPTGITYACACPDTSAPTGPAVVLDPFAGTGTTLLVADALGRTGIGVDLSADYCRLARWRTTDPAERAKALQVPKPPPVPDGQGDLFANEAAS